MFGFSLQKLLVLVAIVAAVWYGFKFISRLDATRKAEAKLREKSGVGPRRRTAKREKESDAEDMVQCPTCQAYVPARGSKSCGRPDCPY